MRPFNLFRVPANDTQPRSIKCLDQKNDTVAVVWADQRVSINARDLYLDEIQQVSVITENFFLFWNNIQEQVEEEIIANTFTII